MKWISTKHKLPKEKTYVLGRYDGGNWHDSDDQENVYCVVVKLVKGISKNEREQMKSGEIPDEITKSWCLPEGWHDTKRSEIESFEDEHSNNPVPYAWQTFGARTFPGLDISHWAEIEPLKKTSR